jgi:hypothetical protein
MGFFTNVHKVPLSHILARDCSLNAQRVMEVTGAENSLKNFAQMVRKAASNG